MYDVDGGACISTTSTAMSRTTFWETQWIRGMRKKNYYLCSNMHDERKNNSGYGTRISEKNRPTAGVAAAAVRKATVTRMNNETANRLHETESLSSWSHHQEWWPIAVAATFVVALAAAQGDYRWSGRSKGDRLQPTLTDGSSRTRGESRATANGAVGGSNYGNWRQQQTHERFCYRRRHWMDD